VELEDQVNVECQCGESLWDVEVERCHVKYEVEL
jgi:hypothetical protein